MAQMYIDLYLSKQKVGVEEYNALGMSSLQIAMKLEEIDVVNLESARNPYSQEYTLAQYEQKVMQVLEFKLLPDTLYHWVEIFMTYWDNYATNLKPEPSRHLFKSILETSGGEPVLRQISLSEENMFRRVMQIIDLISLHAEMHAYHRSTLALAVVAL